MRREPEDGGPAFPQVSGWDRIANTMDVTGGMSLRDWFAGQAINGIVQDCMFERLLPGDPTCRTETDLAAERAYKVADAMLAARDNRRVPEERAAPLDAEALIQFCYRGRRDAKQAISEGVLREYQEGRAVAFGDVIAELEEARRALRSGILGDGK